MTLRLRFVNEGTCVFTEFLHLAFGIEWTGVKGV